LAGKSIPEMNSFVLSGTLGIYSIKAFLHTLGHENKLLLCSYGTSKFLIGRQLRLFLWKSQKSCEWENGY